MQNDRDALQLLEQEARALLTRLARVHSFALNETMVPAAALSIDAQVVIERYLERGRRDLRRIVGRFIDWLRSDAALTAGPAEAQRRFSIVRLRFNAVLSQFDIFADVITQRSEHQTGVWIAGLDAAAADALALPGYYDAPPVACYLDRGHGAAIRRQRTRMPGGGANPVALIRVPRERMVGSGIASSLIHEVGHQGAALLDLITSLRQLLRGFQSGPQQQRMLWACWERWISEILADFWSVARLGVTATQGLISVVSLPRVFVFRLTLADPHPSPYIRVKLSCALGQALYPDPQWAALARRWDAYYPASQSGDPASRLLADLEASIPLLVHLLVNHRPPALRGRTLPEAMETDRRRPKHLRQLYDSWLLRPELIRSTRPALALAVIGQARADNRLSPERESHQVASLLTYWALRNTLDRSANCVKAQLSGAPSIAISLVRNRP